MVNAFIINRLGTVHRMVGNSTCPNATTANMRKFIGYKQALVYGLVACANCWPAAGRFEQWRQTGGNDGKGQTTTPAAAGQAAAPDPSEAGGQASGLPDQEEVR